jgi:hypothetical protein
MVVMENFEFYSTNEDLCKAWIYPNHGGWIRQTLDRTVKHGGTQCLKVEFKTLKEPKKFYCHMHQQELGSVWVQRVSILAETGRLGA